MPTLTDTDPKIKATELFTEAKQATGKRRATRLLILAGFLRGLDNDGRAAALLERTDTMLKAAAKWRPHGYEEVAELMVDKAEAALEQAVALLTCGVTGFQPMPRICVWWVSWRTAVRPRSAP